MKSHRIRRFTEAPQSIPPPHRREALNDLTAAIRALRHVARTGKVRQFINVYLNEKTFAPRRESCSLGRRLRFSSPPCRRMRVLLLGDRLPRRSAIPLVHSDGRPDFLFPRQFARRSRVENPPLLTWQPPRESVLPANFLKYICPLEDPMA